VILRKTLFVPPDAGDVGTWCAWNNNNSQLFPFALILVNPAQASFILPGCALAMPACLPGARSRRKARQQVEVSGFGRVT